MWTWFIGNALAATWTVGPSQSLTSVQAAIGAAASGDVVLVEPGTYPEALQLLGKDLDIRSTTGAGVTVLEPPLGQTAARYDGESGGLEGFTLRLEGGRGVDVRGGAPLFRNLVIEGPGTAATNGGAFRIRGGQARLVSVSIADPVGAQGGGIHISDGAEVSLVSVSLTNAQASWGGGLFIASSVVVASDLALDMPYADYEGGGVYLDGSELTVSSLTIVDARGDLTPGVGIHLRNGARLEVDGGAIRGGLAASASLGYDGGGLYLDATSSAELSDVTFANNQARRGGAIASDGGDLRLTSTVFDGNTALEEGGAVAATSSASLELIGARFATNRAREGGAVHLRTLARYVDTASVYVGNEASESGGALLATGAGAVDLVDLTFLSNRAETHGGALAIDTVPSGLLLNGVRFDSNAVRSGHGGAIHLGGDTPLEASSSTFLSNRAVAGNGGAIAGRPALLDEAADLSILRCRFQANQAGTDGGAVSGEGIDELLVHESELLGNTAAGRGGGVFADGARALDLERATWHANVAAAGGGVFETASVQPSSIRSCTFSENQAATGGGVELRATAAAEVVNNTFVGNGASDEGAHLYIGQGTVRLVNTIAVGATDGGGIYGDATAAALSDRFYHLTHQNSGGDWVGFFTTPPESAQALTADPRFLAYTLDGNAADDDLRLQVGSPAIDSGDPALVDVDGSRSDLGAWGGPAGFVVDQDGDGSYAHVDCDDNDPRRAPSLVELPYDGLDQDCDGADLSDVDTDGWDGGPNGTDCDDRDPDVYPNAPDTPYDGLDADCAGDSDFDVDGDGFDSDAFGGTDCDDTEPGVKPGGIERYYDGVDGNCDGRSDYDQDQDGRDALLYGGDDCNDVDASVYRGAPERCDGGDNDCNGLVDDDPVDPRTYYVDADADGFGDANRWSLHCSLQPGLADNGLDCDDTEAAVNPSAVERWYDGIDDNCDGRDDDQDGDGHPLADDCDDLDDTVHPGAEEQLNGIDDDCDGFAETDDRDDDGLPDWDEWTWGTDPMTPDSDGDGLQDGIEATAKSAPDTDQDGGIDALDPDDDGDGISTSREHAIDVDGDGVADPDVDGDGQPNHLDLDADDDGRPDAEEGTADADRDGIPDFVDPQGPFGGGGCQVGGMGPFWLGLLLLWALRPATGQAQGLDGHAFEVFNTTNDPRSGLRVSEGGRGLRGLATGVVVDGAAQPVVERLSSGDVPIIDGLVTINPWLGAAPLSWLKFDVAMPVHVLGSGSNGLFAAPGDLRLGAGALVRPQEGRRLGITGQLYGWIPTGAAARFVGLPAPAVAPMIALGQRMGRFGWAVNAGVRLGGNLAVRNVDVGSGFVAGASAHVGFGPWWLVRAEVVSDGGTGFSTFPIEASVGAAWRPASGPSFTLDVGVGMGTAPGVPSWRIAFGTAFGPSADLPVITAQPPPPPPAAVARPDVIEVRFVPIDVSPPEPVIAEVQDDRIVVSEQVFFQEGKADLLKRSIPVLRAVLGVLRQHPEVDYLLVEGHTNHHGGADYNVWLSQARADTVLGWMMDQGVPRGRLLSEGYGFSRPLVAPDAEDAAEVNRRVEFVLVRSDERETAPAVPAGPRGAPPDVPMIEEASLDPMDAVTEVPPSSSRRVRDQRFPSPAETWLD
ncbi:MAG: MopE-related protein [Myxococcota bacterium]